MSNSVLPPEMRGVMFVSGYRGVGKSFLAAQADAPQNVAYFDFENKGEGIHGQLQFGLYRALTQEATGGPTELYDVTMDAFRNLEQDRYTVAVLDNVSPLELALQAGARKDVRRYVEEYGLNLKNVLSGRFGGLKSVVNYLISDQVCSTLHKRGVRLIVSTAHIKARWGAGGIIPNKYRLKGADRWQELSILTLVLVPGEHAPVPAALVRKEQLGLLTWNEVSGEHQISRRLPFRIPKCTFAEIRRYLHEPADLQNPPDDERIRRSESDPFDEQLSREQIDLMRMAMRQEDRETVDDEDLMDLIAQDEDISKAKSLKAEGKSLPAIAKTLGVPVSKVARMLK